VHAKHLKRAKVQGNKQTKQQIARKGAKQQRRKEINKGRSKGNIKKYYIISFAPLLPSNALRAIIAILPVVALTVYRPVF
jgi:hypothetical protein